MNKQRGRPPKYDKVNDTIRVKPANYQPTKAELEKEFDSLPISPSNLARCLRGDVVIEKEKKRKAATL